MPGINLSSSAEQSTDVKNHSAFGRGAVSIVIVLLLLVGVWLGIDFYGKKLAAEISVLDTAIESKSADFSGEDVDSVDTVADIQFRIDILKAALKQQSSPSVMLGSVEALLLPGVRLSKYSFDSNEREISFSGKSESLGTLAKQMVLIKSIPDFSTLSVQALSRKKENEGKSEAFMFDFSVKLLQ